ncbi:TPA: DNA-binding protein [Neisseria meningitidis]|uniref:DNA-binding protein n=1 Tax=Neisseria meningitidis TaxID=487 RepID=UPI002B4AC5D5|nr:DNA-binding protein [Neisseria meningitidis]
MLSQWERAIYGYTVEKLKENFAKNGQTLAQWARENGFKPRDVYLVIGGQRKGNYGKGHEIAKKLGLK